MASLVLNYWAQNANMHMLIWSISTEANHTHIKLPGDLFLFRISCRVSILSEATEDSKMRNYMQKHVTKFDPIKVHVLTNKHGTLCMK